MSLLNVHKLTMRFGGLTAVSDVCLDVPKDAIFSVIGPNGAGKTTLFNAITGIYDPTTGSIRCGGRDLRRPFSPVRCRGLLRGDRHSHQHRGIAVVARH